MDIIADFFRALLTPSSLALFSCSVCCTLTCLGGAEHRALSVCQHLLPPPVACSVIDFTCLPFLSTSAVSFLPSPRDCHRSDSFAAIGRTCPAKDDSWSLFRGFHLFMVRLASLTREPRYFCRLVFAKEGERDLAPLLQTLTRSHPHLHISPHLLPSPLHNHSPPLLLSSTATCLCRCGSSGPSLRLFTHACALLPLVLT